MTKDEALKLAPEALESSRVFVTTREKIKHPEGTEWYDQAITAIKEALAQPEPEPVIDKSAAVRIATLLGWTPQRKPLTDEQIADIVIEMNGNEPTAPFWRDLARAIEAAHGIKE